MSSNESQHVLYEQGQQYPAPYRYEDATDQQPSQDEAIHFPPQPQTPPIQAPTKTPSEAKPRLRKACDSCSVRKVKCDENTPCRSCASLDIPCTFNRPSRRRGPPNRHAEAIKRQKLEDGSYNLFAASPTRDAAYSLAALSAPALAASALSAESICDYETLEILIDDYFMYIHPLIPFPHEPTFRDAFVNRDDKTDRSFLALIAVMIEVLVASFPRRPRQLFTSEQARQQYPNAGALIDRCHQVFSEARGPGYLDRHLTLNDAACSYFAAIAAAYMFDMHRTRLYMGESVMILRTLGFHKADEAYQPKTPYENAGSSQIDHIYQQSGRRLFWLCFVGAMSMRQLGAYDADILMPPLSHAEMLPPLPAEVDDDFITTNTIHTQPVGVVSMLTGFNINTRVFRAFHNLAALEMAFGIDTVFDWDRQRQLIRRALANVKAVTRDAPAELQLSPSGDISEWPPRTGDAAAYSHLFNGRQDPATDAVGLHAPGDPRRLAMGLPYPKRSVQYEIQKANIYATQLATRSHLVEKYWNLYEVHDQQQPVSASLMVEPSLISSPTAACVAAGIDSRYQQSLSGRTPSESHVDSGEQAMAVEREDIVRDMAYLLKNINQTNMEPNGLSFCHKIRQVASTLLSQDRARMAVMPTLDTTSVNQYLIGFCEILSKLERLGPSRIRGDDGINGGLRTLEQIEQEELVHWASLKEYQEHFVRNQGFVDGV